MKRIKYSSMASKADDIETAFGSSVETTVELVNENAELATQVLIYKTKNYE